MSAENNSLTDEQRTSLRAAAEEFETACDQFNKIIEDTGCHHEWDGSCLACPKHPGKPVCSSFLGDDSSPRARCKRGFCGHSFMTHVGGA